MGRRRLQRMRTHMPAHRRQELHLLSLAAREEALSFGQSHHRMGSSRRELQQGHLLLQGSHRRRLERTRVGTFRHTDRLGKTKSDWSNVPRLFCQEGGGEILYTSCGWMGYGYAVFVCALRVLRNELYDMPFLKRFLSRGTIHLVVLGIWVSGYLSNKRYRISSPPSPFLLSSSPTLL